MKNLFEHVSLPLENVMKGLLQQTFKNYNFEAEVVCFVRNYNSAIIKNGNGEFYVDNVGQLIENLQNSETKER